MRVWDVVGKQLERRSGAWLTAFSGLYLMVTLMIAQRRFWYDELFTWHMSRLPDMAAVWAALKEGADLNPPLFYFVTRTSQMVAGAGPAGTRLPAVMGFLVMCLCLYRFVSRRAGSAAGFVALLLPVLTGGYYYAAEARSYGFEFGLVGIALLTWQDAADSRRRRWWSLPVFTLALAGALLTHCYATLAVIPFALAEAVRNCRQRRIDWAVWACFAALAPVMLVYSPLMAALKPFKMTNPVFQPTLLYLPRFYDFLMHKAIWPVLGAVLAANVRRNQPEPEEFREVPVHEWVCAGAFAATPLFAYVLAAGVTGVLMDRYGLAAMIGLSLLLAFYASHRGGTRGAGRAALVLAVAAVLLGVGFMAEHWGEHKQTIVLKEIRSELPIVVSNGLLFLEEDFYQPEGVARRMRFLTDEAAGLRYTGSNNFDYGYPIMQKWFHLRGRVEPYKQFLQANRRFLVYGTATYPMDWLIRRLTEQGAHLRLLQSGESAYGETSLLEVNLD